MVWKIAKRLAVMVVACVITCYCTYTQAHAYTPYTDGTISNTYTTMYRDIVPRLSVKDDYIFFRSGQYEYVMLVGEFDYANNVFTTRKPITEYKLTLSSGYNSTYKYTVNTVQAQSINVGETMVYSNLGNYPILEEKGEIFGYASFITLFVMCVCMLIRPIFNFTMRLRSR